MKEKQIEKQIVDWLRYQGFWVTKVQAGGMVKSYTDRKTGAVRFHKINLAERGVPDLIACLGGKFLAIEIKKSAREIQKWQDSAETDDRSAAQHYQQDLIRQAGGFTLVVCSIEDLQKDLIELHLIALQ